MTLTSYGLPVSGAPILCGIVYPALKHPCLVATHLHQMTGSRQSCSSQRPVSLHLQPGRCFHCSGAPTRRRGGRSVLRTPPLWPSVSTQCSPSPGPPVQAGPLPAPCPSLPAPPSRPCPALLQGSWESGAQPTRRVALMVCDILGGTEGRQASRRALITPLPPLSWSPGGGDRHPPPSPQQGGWAREDLTSSSLQGKDESCPLTPPLNEARGPPCLPHLSAR